MSKFMYRDDWAARAEAFDEAADHLDQSWTDDPKERKQSVIVSKRLRRMAEACWSIAAIRPVEKT